MQFLRFNYFIKNKINLFLGLMNFKKRVVLYLSWRRIPCKKNSYVAIIAGGPSFTAELAKCLIENRKSIDVAALNFYCLNSLADSLVPDYYILSDHSDFSLTENNKNKTMMSYLMKKKPIFFHPYGSRLDLDIAKSFMFDDAENLNSNNISPLFPRGYTSNTALKSIALMLALGYEKIFVLGLDYDYPRKVFVNEDNKIMLKEEHHYGVEIVNISQYHKSLADALSCWANDYRHMKKLASTKVINVTKNSLVDSFNRITPNEFIEKINFIGVGS